MSKGPAGYGRYDDDPEHVGCPWAKSDMTPCIARDGHVAMAGEPPTDCVGCGHSPAYLLADLAADYEPARAIASTLPAYPDLADKLAELVRAATEPAAAVPAPEDTP